jgi:hypothetical protein
MQHARDIIAQGCPGGPDIRLTQISFDQQLLSPILLKTLSLFEYRPRGLKHGSAGLAIGPKGLNPS